jgi:hypothetical protein
MDAWMWWYIGIGVIIAIFMLWLMTDKENDERDSGLIIATSIAYIPLWGFLVVIVIIVAPFVILHEYFLKRQEK